MVCVVVTVFTFLVIVSHQRHFRMSEFLSLMVDLDNSIARKMSVFLLSKAELKTSLSLEKQSYSLGLQVKSCFCASKMKIIFTYDGQK